MPISRSQSRSKLLTRVVSGEIPILFDYDFNAYRAKYGESGNFEFVIPAKARWCFLTSRAWSKRAGPGDRRKKVLDYFLSDKGQGNVGQRLFAPFPADRFAAGIDQKSKFLPATDYARAKSVDWAKMESGCKTHSPSATSPK